MAEFQIVIDAINAIKEGTGSVDAPMFL